MPIGRQNPREFTSRNKDAHRILRLRARISKPSTSKRETKFVERGINWWSSKRRFQKRQPRPRVLRNLLEVSPQLQKTRFCRVGRDAIAASVQGMFGGHALRSSGSERQFHRRADVCGVLKLAQQSVVLRTVVTKADNPASVVLPRRCRSCLSAVISDRRPMLDIYSTFVRSTIT
jgi:hypothetical protein